MNSNGKKVIILKNDAVGDLTQSLKAINNIINSHQNKIIEIYLSERSEKFNFLISNNNVIFKKLNCIKRKFKRESKNMVVNYSRNKRW